MAIMFLSTEQQTKKLQSHMTPGMGHGGGQQIALIQEPSVQRSAHLLETPVA
jgi:hypothetical protein